ncbi:SDR family oxidoreductase [Massilia sp. IC2-278]|uniref:SDR family oxidoreductase n=1 Tax=Massilia sp. IC2-278 TaxID=2887200 RepID=UPI001E61250E|nr:SDR family oxidoreductase [Massilia sp. IC2-278]MCC2960358.1 SDR family oxidoreductase [Massilia sp. IC2-278]
MSTPLQDKIAFINGGSRGIGAAIARRLAHDGAVVALTYRDSAAAAEALAADIEAAGGRALALRCDAADPASLRDAIDSVAAQLGRIDILVNNAGVFRAGTIDSATLEDFDYTVGINVRSVFAASQAALRHMPQGGRIVNISSTNALRMPMAGAALYAMSKSALTGLVKGLAHDLAPRGITINNVLPGPVDTDMNPENNDFGQSLHSFMALQRHGRPEEVAGMVAYLASAEAAFVTGADLLIDGGFAA